MATSTGKCLCGAVRFMAEDVNPNHSVCHCGMCRKWGGGGPFFAARNKGVTFESDAHVGRFASSDWAERGFCTKCGTTLFYTNDAVFPGQVDVQIATLDDPDAIKPDAQIQVAERIGWMAGLDQLPVFDRYPG